MDHGSGGFETVSRPVVPVHQGTTPQGGDAIATLGEQRRDGDQEKDVHHERRNTHRRHDSGKRNGDATYHRHEHGACGIRKAGETLHGIGSNVLLEPNGDTGGQLTEQQVCPYERDRGTDAELDDRLGAGSGIR